MSSLEITIRTSLPRAIVQEFLALPCGFAPPSADIGLMMHGPHKVDIVKSSTAYLDLHHDFHLVAVRQAQALKDLKCDLLLSDVDYTGLAGAALLGVPAVAICSFHWGEAVANYLPDTAEMDLVVAQILDAYNSAIAFLLAEPRITVPGLSNVRQIAPLVRYWGHNQKLAILEKLGAPQHARIGVVAFGGMQYGYPQLDIPQTSDWIWIVPDNWPFERSRRDIFRQTELGGQKFTDIVASSDLIVTKTGYGTFMECATHGVPCLFLSRPDWPESPEIETWMTRNGYGRPLSSEEMATTDWFSANMAFIDARRNPLVPGGHLEAVELLLSIK